MRHVRPLALEQRTVATTYTFRPADGRGDSVMCTVNDSTGELAIRSGWGHWSHRWHPSPDALGAPTLTAFLGDRGGAHYIADKLTSTHENSDQPCRYVFDSYETVRELRRMAGERYGWKRIDRMECRAFCEDFNRLRGIETAERFIELYFKIECYEMITEEPWHVIQQRHTPAYLYLLHAIIPALIEACRESHARLMNNLIDAIGAPT